MYRFSWLDKTQKRKSHNKTINPINKKDNKCFQHAVKVALNYEEIKKDQQRITKTFYKYNWVGINFPPEKDGWKKLGKYNVTIALNGFYAKKEKMYPASVSKHNSNCEKHVIPLIIWNGEKQWHYLAVKRLSALLRGITSKNNGDFYCLNCLHSFRTKNKLGSHKRVCENKDFCTVIISPEDTKISEFNQYQKSHKAPFITYANLECIIEKIDGCKNNPENLNKTRAIQYTPSGCSMSRISSFRRI